MGLLSSDRDNFVHSLKGSGEISNFRATSNMKKSEKRRRGNMKMLVVVLLVVMMMAMATAIVMASDKVERLS